MVLYIVMVFYNSIALCNGLVLYICAAIYNDAELYNGVVLYNAADVSWMGWTMLATNTMVKVSKRKSGPF